MIKHFIRLISIALMVLLLLSISAIVFGQEKYSVSGEIIFYEEQGGFLLRIKTYDELENAIRSAPPERTLLIKPTQKELKAKKVQFKFVNIPAGTYCIYCLHDLNINGKMDTVPETGFPAEPFGYSGPLVFGKAMWEDVSFKVDKDISGIEIKL